MEVLKQAAEAKGTAAASLTETPFKQPAAGWLFYSQRKKPLMIKGFHKCCLRCAQRGTCPDAWNLLKYMTIVEKGEQ